MFGYDGSVRIKADLNHSDFDRGIAHMTKSVNNFGGTLKKVAGIIGTVFGVAALVNFGKQAVKLASDIQEVQNVIDVTFGSGAAKIEEFAQSAAEAFGLSELSAKQYAGTMGAMLKSSGLATSAAQDMSIALSGLAGDLASFYNLNTDEAFEKIRSGISGETEPLKQLGINMSVANLEAYALSKGITKSYKSMSQAEQVLLRYNYLLSVTTDAQGDFARTSGSFANQIRILQLNFDQLKIAVGNALIPIAQAVLPGINAIIAALTKLARVFAKVTNLLFGRNTEVKTETGVASSASSAATATDKLTESTENAGSAAKKAAKDMKGVQAGFDELNILAGKAASSLGDAAGGLDLSNTDVELPDVDTEGEIFSDVEISPKLKEDIEALRDALDRIWDVFKKSWELNGPEVIDAAKRALESIYELLKAIGRAFTEAWTGGAGLEFLNAVWDFLEMILNVIADIADAWKTAFDNVGTEFFESILFMFTEILKLLTSIGEAFREAWNDGSGVEICETILKIFTNIYNTIGTIAMKLREAWEANGNGVAIWNAILDIVQTVLSFIERLTASTLEWAKGLNFEPLMAAFRGLLEAIEPLVAVITDGLAYAYENVLLPFGKWFLEELAPVGIELVTAAIEALTAVLEAIKPLAEWLWENFLQPISEWTGGVIVTVLEAIADGLHDIASVINGELSLTDFIAQLTPLQTLLLGIASALVAVKVAAAGMALVETIRKIVEYLTKLDLLDAPGIIGKLAQVFTIASSSAYTFSDAMQMVFGPGSILAGIGALVGGAVTAITNFISMLKNGFSWANEALMLLGIAISAVGAIILGAPALVAGVIAGIVAAVATMVVVLKDNWEEVKKAGAEAWEKIKEAWNAAGEWFSKNVAEPIAKFFKDAWENVKQFAADAWEAVQDAWDSASEWFNTNVVEPVAEFFSGLWEDVQQLASDAWDRIVSVWETVSGWFDENIIQPVAEFFGDLWDGIKEGASELWYNVVSIWEKAGDWFKTNVADPIGAAFEAVGEFIKGVFNGIIGTVEGMINGVIKGINWLIEQLNKIKIDIPEGVPLVGGTKFGINIQKVSDVKLPRLANGAVIPPNQQFAAVLGDQRSGMNFEAPAGLVRQMVTEGIQAAMAQGGGFGRGGNMTVVLEVDKREWGRATVKFGGAEYQRIGTKLVEART